MSTDSRLGSTWLRRTTYTLLIVSSVGTMVGRILDVESKRGDTAMLSANDRSRWCAIRALGDLGTPYIDQVIRRSDGRRDPEWNTIDKVRHKGHDGKEHYYSSKPPLLIYMLTGQYQVVKLLTGASLTEHPFNVMRIMLVLTNVLPMILYFVLLAGLIEKLGTSDWGRIYVMAIATWGTFLTTFSVTINNHLPAAISILIATLAAVAVIRDGRRQPWLLAIAGCFAALAIANELPALSFFAMLGAALLWKAPRQTMVGFVPGAAVVAAVFFITNHQTHGSWRPPYLHRHDGPVVAQLPGSVGADLQTLLISPALSTALKDQGTELSSRAVLQRTQQAPGWMVWDPVGQKRLAIRAASHGFDVRQWGNWYEYAGTYWVPKNKRGVDRGEPSRLVYAFHSLIGHRGILSLTPVWLLSLFGIGIWLRGTDTSLFALAVMVTTLTVVCLTFYLMRPLEDRNYGGVCCGFRWMFWFIPLWTICVLPAADRISDRRWCRGIAWGLLAVSIMSATYASMNPWAQSWIFDYWTYLEWIQY
jgi:hypothetical protein